MSDILDVRRPVVFDESISKFEYHIIMPQTGTNFARMAEISMEIADLDIFTLPHRSYIYMEGTFLANNAAPARSRISSNGFAFLFEEIRYELNTVEIDRTRNVGIASTMKNIVSLGVSDSEGTLSAGWDPASIHDSIVDANGRFAVCIPLSFLLGFAEDYKKIIVHARQKLILIRGMEDKNCYKTTGAAEDCKITISHLSWRIPFVTPGDPERLDLLRIVDQKKWIQVPFRSWELFEYPSLPASSSESWTIKSSTQLEKPRYVIFGFQTARKDSATKSTSEFDHCNVTDVKLFVNNEVYPYINMNLDFTQNHYMILYNSFAEFRKSFYGKPSAKPYLTPNQFKTIAPLVVIDCSRQNDSIKSGVVNFRLEFRTSANIPANTRAFALIIHDKIIEYNPFNDMVNKIVSI